MISYRVVTRLMKILVTLCLFLLGGNSLAAREWTDSTGKFHVEAEFVKLVGEKVHLRKPDGKVIAVVIARLNAEGRQAVAAAAQAVALPASKAVPNASIKPLAKSTVVPPSKSIINKQNSQALAKVLSSQKNSLLARLNDRLGHASNLWSSAGKLLNDQSAAISKANARMRPQTLSIGPAEAIQTAVSGLAAHRPRAIWDALPRGYQHDLHALLHDHAANVDPQLWQAGRQVWQKSLLVMRNQQQFLLRYPLVSEALAESAAVVHSTAAPVSIAKNDANSLAAWEAMVNVLTLLAESDLAELPKLRTFDLGSFLDQTGVDLMQQLATTSQMTADDSFNRGLSLVSGMEVSLVSMVGTEATVRLTSGDQSELNSMTLVEGKWIPTELALAWPAMMSTTRAELEKLNTKSLAAAKPQFIGRLQNVQKTLDRLLAAKTQPEFDALLTGLLVTVSEQ